MSDYATTLKKHRRLTILRFLKDCGDYTSNASILSDVCNGMGVNSTRDQITTELAWLKEQGFVTLDDKDSFIVVEATQAGLDIADGRARHPDIQRPRPGQ